MNSLPEGDAVYSWMPMFDNALVNIDVNSLHIIVSFEHIHYYMYFFETSNVWGHRPSSKTPTCNSAESRPFVAVKSVNQQEMYVILSKHKYSRALCLAALDLCYCPHILHVLPRVKYLPFNDVLHLWYILGKLSICKRPCLICTKNENVTNFLLRSTKDWHMCYM